MKPRILDSHPPRPIDADDGHAEALRRSNELDTGRATALSQRELDKKIHARRSNQSCLVPPSQRKTPDDLSGKTW